MQAAWRSCPVRPVDGTALETSLSRPMEGTTSDRKLKRRLPSCIDVGPGMRTAAAVSMVSPRRKMTVLAIYLLSPHETSIAGVAAECIAPAPAPGVVAATRGGGGPQMG